MGRRCRHFSWGAIGASVALDARRITGLSDGATVASWADASGNGRTFANSNSGERPTYNATGINGQSTVLNAAGKGLCISTTLPVGASGEESQFAICKFNAIPGAYQVAIANGSTNGNCMSIAVADTDALMVYDLTTQSRGSVITTSAMVVSATGGPAGRTLQRNGIAETLTNPTTAIPTTRTAQSVDVSIFNSQTYGAGAGNDKFDSALRGDLGIVSSVPYIVTAPIRKRVEHHLALAYKLPCS